MQASTGSELDSDSALIEAVLRGERDRYEALVRRHQKAVFGIAWNQLGSVDLAEEAAQQTFVKAYCKLATLRDPCRFQSWLVRIARNVSVTLGRKRRAELTNRERWHLFPEITDGDSTRARVELTAELRKSLATLPEIHRKILTLFYFEGHTVQQVANSLGLSQSAVKTRLHRARASLRKELERPATGESEAPTPSPGFLPLIIGALPTSAPLGSAAKLKLLAESASIVTRLASLMWLSLVQVIPFHLTLRFFWKGQSQNFHDGAQHDFRRSLALRQPVQVSLMAIVILVASATMFRSFGPATWFRLLSLVPLLGLWQSIRYLRVNDSEYTVGNICVLILQLVAFILMGFFDFHLVTFVVAMLLANLILFRTRRSMPLRLDYNLFLRAATGGLSDENDCPNEGWRVTTSQLKQYAKFLGRNWLVRDYQISGDTLHLFLPPAAPNVLTAIFPGTAGSSQITLNTNGTCIAHLSSVDAKSIHTLATEPVTQDGLSKRVQCAITQSLMHFAAGELPSAAKALCALDDDRVFKTPPSQTSSFRWMFGICIGASVIALASYMIMWLVKP